MFLGTQFSSGPFLLSTTDSPSVKRVGGHSRGSGLIRNRSEIAGAQSQA